MQVKKQNMHKRKYLHCLHDDKFLDGAISLFEEDTRIENTYVLFVQNNKQESFRSIKSSKARIQSIDTFLDCVSDYDVVILHSLLAIPIEMISRIPNPIKVVWLMWGYDFYNFQICNIRLFGPLSGKTLTLRARARLIKSAVLFTLFKKTIYKESLYRIDYFSGVFPYEYDLLKNLPRYPGIKAKPIDFYYGSTNFFIPEEPNYEIENKFLNVIIGNSGDLRNNTLDAFEILNKSLDSKQVEKIIVPLAYGTDTLFINKVKEVGRKLWGEKFLSLDTFIPLDEYLKVVSNCKVAVYFHERQQASDNVLMQLMYGARVFMSETSMMYKYLKSLGFYIYSLQHDYEMINIPLTKEQIITNRTILSEYYSSSKLIERVMEMNNIICNF